MTATKVPAKPLNYEFSRHLEPKVRIESGATLCVESEDALSGQIRKACDVRDKVKMPYSNPIAGPIYVAGGQARRHDRGPHQRNSPDDRPVRDLHGSSQATLRMAGNRCSPRGPRLPNPRRLYLLERAAEDSVLADARLHRHGAGMERAEHAAGRRAWRQHGHCRNMSR